MHKKPSHCRFVAFSCLYVLNGIFYGDLAFGFGGPVFFRQTHTDSYIYISIYMYVSIDVKNLWGSHGQ